MAMNGYEDNGTYDSSWHIIPPDYVTLEEDYRFGCVRSRSIINLFDCCFLLPYNVNSKLAQLYQLHIMHHIDCIIGSSGHSAKLRKNIISITGKISAAH